MQARGRGEVLGETAAVAVDGTIGLGCAQDQARGGLVVGGRGAHVGRRFRRDRPRSLRAVARHPLSIHEPLTGDADRALGDFLDDPSAADPDQMVDQHLLRERIAEVLRSLTPREREVIELRFGLKDGQPRTLDEVAKCYGITRERIRQIEARGLLKLRQPLRSQRLAGFAE